MRLYVKISDDLGQKLNDYSTKFGMSKSGFVAYALGKHISELDYQAKTYDSVMNSVSSVINDLSKGENNGQTY